MRQHEPARQRIDVLATHRAEPKPTAPKLREYQSNAVAKVESSERQSTLVVAPTGAGKSVIGGQLALCGDGAGQRVVWIAHRKELLRQAADHLRSFGLADVAVVAPWAHRDDNARTLVASVDTLLARGSVPQADRVIWDEAHHTPADSYMRVHAAYREAGAHIIGLTATPQRADGRPMGAMYDELIEVASYSELLAAGHLVQCKVFRPDMQVTDGLGRDPLEAWRELAQGQPTFAFCKDVRSARELAQRFRDAGISAACVDGKMDAGARDDAMAGFRAGVIDVLTNVYVLTEGVDVPDARVCLLARNTGHAGTYLQIAGRILRPAPGKAAAMLIDLTGSSHVHGLPTSDREYALEGRAIKVRGEPLKACPKCGTPVPDGARICDKNEGGCGYKWPAPKLARVRIHNMELHEATEAAGGNAAEVSDDVKRRELVRLIEHCEARGWDLGWAFREYKKTLGAPPVGWMLELTTAEQRARTLAKLRERKGKGGFYIYKQIFGGK